MKLRILVDELQKLRYLLIVMKWGGPILLLSTVTLGLLSGALNPFGSEKNSKEQDDDTPLLDSTASGSEQSTNSPSTITTNVPVVSTNADGSLTTNYPTVTLPVNPTDGSIPEGYYLTRNGTAAVCFDGTGYHPVGDTYIPATAHTINGQYLNGDVTPYVVVNRADYGNIPMGSKVYVYNHNTGQGTWAIAGDRGPDNIGKTEISVATARAIGATIPTDSNGNMQNAIASHSISIYAYN